MHKSQIFFYSGLLFLLGIIFSTNSNLLVSLFIIVFVLFLFLYIFIFWNPKFFIILVLGLSLILGFIYYIFWKNFFIHNLDFREQSNFYKGIVLEKIKEDRFSSLFVIKLGKENKNARIIIKASKFYSLFYGDLISFSCKFIKPKKGFEKYLELKRAVGFCIAKDIQVLEHNKANYFLFGIFKFRQLFLEKINRLYYEPFSSLIAGILIGERTSIPEDLQQAFKQTGLTHIVAISGYNINLVANFVIKLFLFLYISLHSSFWIAVVFIVLFTIFTGAGSSVVRACIMGIIILYSRKNRRLSYMKNIILLVVILMVLFNPNVLLYDISFQLSISAVIGLVYFYDFFENKFLWVTEKFLLRESIVSSLSASILTYPIILYNFHQISLVGPVSNLLVLPFIPILMLLSFISLIFSIFSYKISVIFIFLSIVISNYIYLVVLFLSKIPLGFIDFNSF